MILIIGGAFQGKKDYALKNFDISENEIYKSGSINDISSHKLVTDYHIIIKKMMQQNIDPVAFTKTLCLECKDTVIIMDEIGCGIIPMDRCEREWRETVGRCGCILARNAEKVIRMICGIPVILKESK